MQCLPIVTYVMGIVLATGTHLISPDLPNNPEIIITVYFAEETSKERRLSSLPKFTHTHYTMAPVSPNPCHASGSLYIWSIVCILFAHTFVLLALLPGSLSPLPLFHVQDEVLWRWMFSCF